MIYDRNQLIIRWQSLHELQYTVFSKRKLLLHCAPFVLEFLRFTGSFERQSVWILKRKAPLFKHVTNKRTAMEAEGKWYTEYCVGITHFMTYLVTDKTSHMLKENYVYMWKDPKYVRWYVKCMSYCKNILFCNCFTVSLLVGTAMCDASTGVTAWMKLSAA